MPVVSVIMPVFNGEAHLKEAIESILTQTFDDFELIIVNDGSKDRSGEIIRSFTDKRIRYMENDQNRGLIYSLNRAIDTAVGRYIARMDADDVCFPDRLEVQKKWLERNPCTSVVASFSETIDDSGHKTGDLANDRDAVTARLIK